MVHKNKLQKYKKKKKQKKKKKRKEKKKEGLVYLTPFSTSTHF